MYDVVQSPLTDLHWFRKKQTTPVELQKHAHMLTLQRHKSMQLAMILNKTTV